MNKIKSRAWNVEKQALVALSIVFVTAILGSWVFAMKVRQTVVSNSAVTTVDPSALIEVERLRNIVESQISNSRSFFLLGSKVLFDKQKKDQQILSEAITKFERQYNLPRVPEILKHIEALEQQQQEIFDQAMVFRGQQTDSKIVGQFYQSKVSPLRNQINDSLDEIVNLHNAELDRARAQAKESARSAEVQIPRGMAWFTGILVILFFGMASLVVRMLRERSRQLEERHRLYNEAKNAIQDRDEVLSAIAYDLREPLQSLNAVAEHTGESAELIKSYVGQIEVLVREIGDQKSSELGNLTLRLDQSGIDETLDDARLMLQPLAKQRDVRLQFETANPPVLAFFDRERVMRVLSHLIGNAIKFSPKHGKVVIKVRSDQQFVNISIVDNGPGIPERQLPEIFENFWQARKTADQGSGVGLAVVKTIIEAHGGRVNVDSRPGQGSTFTFSLPRRRPVGAQLKKPAPIRATTRSQTHTENLEGPGL